MPRTKLDRQTFQHASQGLAFACSVACVCLSLPAVVCAVDKLAQAGVQHIVYWSAEQPGPQLVAAHFGHVFAAALHNSSTTVPEVCITVVRCWSHACVTAMLCFAVLCCAVPCLQMQASGGRPISAVLLLSLSQQLCQCLDHAYACINP